MRTVLVFLLLFTFRNVQEIRAQEFAAVQPRGVPTEQITIVSKVLHEERKVLVGLPRGYGDSSIGYPIVLALDGEYSFDHFYAVTQFLSRSGAVPPMIVVGVVNTDRERDFTPRELRIARDNPDGESFLDFIEQELLQEMRARFRVEGPRILVGHSSGGMLAVFAHATRAHLVDAIIALDAPFHLDSNWLHVQMMARIKSTERQPIRMIVAETRFSYVSRAWDELVKASPAGSILRKFAVNDESHQSMDFTGFYRGMKTLFAEYPLAKPNNTLASIQATYEQLSQSFGGTIYPPAAAFNRAIEDCLLEIRVEDAKELHAEMIRFYGESSATNELSARIEEASRAAPLEETVKDLIEGKKATAKEIQSYVGTWSGTMTTEGSTPNKISFRIGVENERASGKVMQQRPNAESEAQDLVVIRLRDGALQLGYMNRMNPRGVLLSTLRLTEEGNVSTLEGELKLAGVRFELPHGRTLPRILVEVSRAAED